MGNRKPKAAPPTPGRFRRARPVVGALLTLGVLAGLLLGLGWLGDEARRRVGPRERYAVRFADIDCDAPPGLDRPTFLAEVRYASGFPDTVNLLDPELTPKLTVAFAAHPWVEAVDGVAVEPPDRLRVRLRFRTSVLAVAVEGGGVRVVDGKAVLLPLSASPADLPELATPVTPPGCRAGHAWPDETVKRAVELVTVYRPRRLERMPTGWRLTLPEGRTIQVVR